MHRDSGRAQARAPDDVVAALEHHRSGQFDAARLVYWKSLRRGVIDSRIPYLMACLEIHADNPEKATNWFCKAIRREMHKGRAAPLNGDGIPDGFTGALVFDPQPVHTCRQLSLALHARGERQLATLALKAWLAYVPADPHALALLGEVADRTADQDPAGGPGAQVHSIGPNGPSAVLESDNAGNGPSEPRPSRGTDQAGADGASDPCVAEIRRALAFQERGRLTAAEQAIANALRLHPDHPEGLLTKADLLFEKGQCDDAVKCYQRVLAIEPQHAAAWLHLGHAWKRKGLLRKAVEAYRQAFRFGPDNPNAPYYLGMTLHALQDDAGAANALKRSLALSPGHVSARHLLNALTGVPVSQAPLEYIEALFDRYAASFDFHMKGLLNYRIPAIMRKYLKPLAKRRGPFNRLLDIGCGTGLAGAALQDLARSMTGVDVSRKSIELATAKSIYERLFCDDFHNFLKAGDEPFDLVVAADVFIYTGDLNRAFSSIRRRLVPGGGLAFSTEKATRGDFQLQRSGRFAHAPPYILRLADTHGFRIRTARPVPIRMDGNRWINGDFFLMDTDA